MKRLELIIFLVVELVILVSAVLAFKLFEKKATAGLVAGSLFLLMGLLIFFRTLSWPHRWRSLVFWVNLLYLFGVALPMMVSYIDVGSEGFRQAEILGISASKFHWASEQVYLSLLLATLVDLIRAKKMSGTK